MSPDVAGILLAAGSGSRLGIPKALVVLGGQSLAQRGVATLHAGGAHPIIVVTGAAPLDMADLTSEAGGPTAAAGRPEVISVVNPRWQTGMGSSVIAGLEAVSAGCAAAVLALADQPLVGPEAVRRLIAAHAAGASVAVACYAGQPRNPVLISRAYFAEVADLAAGDTGARPFLRAHPDLVTRVDCSDTGRPDDIDTAADLARVTELLGDSAPFPA